MICSDRNKFCSKTIREYENYQNSLSIQLSGLTEVDNATWSYLPQTLRKSNGDRVSFSVFLDELLLTPWNAPKLFVIHAPASYGKTAFSYASTKKLAEQHMLNAGHAFPIFIPFAKYRRFGGIRDILRAEIEGTATLRSKQSSPFAVDPLGPSGRNPRWI